MRRTTQNIQIIAVDDRSTDPTGSIMDTIAAQYPNQLRALHITKNSLPAGSAKPTPWLSPPAEPPPTTSSSPTPTSSSTPSPSASH